MFLSLLLCFILKPAFTTDFYITNPYSVSKWRQNDNVKISWNIIPGGHDIESVNIDLMDGDDDNASLIANIGSSISASQTSFDWYIPFTVNSSNTYFIRLTGNGPNPVYRFSHRFSIEGNGKWAPKITSSSTNSTPTKLTSKFSEFSLSTINSVETLSIITTTTRSDNSSFKSLPLIPLVLLALLIMLV
jgi:hypothetical protein